MAYVDIVTALAVLQFLVFGFKVGKARGRYGVKAPAVTGNEVFERHFRVQQNTLEQLIAFLPGLYLFSHYYSPRVAAGLGLVYLIGREMYAFTYVKDGHVKRSTTKVKYQKRLVGLLIETVRKRCRGWLVDDS